MDRLTIVPTACIPPERKKINVTDLAGKKQVRKRKRNIKMKRKKKK